MSESAVKSRKFSCRWFVLASTKHCSLLFKLKFNQVLPSAFLQLNFSQALLISVKSQIRTYHCFAVLLLSKRNTFHKSFEHTQYPSVKQLAQLGANILWTIFLNQIQIWVSQRRKKVVFSWCDMQKYFIFYTIKYLFGGICKNVLYLMSCTLVSPPTTNRSVVWRSKLATKLRNNSTFLSLIIHLGITQHFVHPLETEE